MPELPEVETTLRGIQPHLQGRTVTGVIVRNRQLRWPVPAQLARRLVMQPIITIRRRAKYLLFEFPRAHLLLHLGMSGSLRINAIDSVAGPYDHFELQFDNGQCLRLRDPRRFGSVHYCRSPVLEHPLLKTLGPEPLSNAFDGGYLYQKSRHRKQSVKTFLMDSRIVVGVGNIYASEALFEAGIAPTRAAGRIARPRYERLADAIKSVLAQAIAKGGTTLRDFTRAEGQPGYFRHELKVYDRADQPCHHCAAPIRQIRQGQRSTYYCLHCQR